MKELYQFPKWNNNIEAENKLDFRFLTKDFYISRYGGEPEVNDVLVFKKEDDEDISGS